MHLISYVESEVGAHFLPPTDWPDGAFTWLCRIDGRHYARVASLDYGDQDADIDLTVHDLAIETELADKLDALAVDRIEARHLRAGRYDREMPIGEQLDAILKALDQLRLCIATFAAASIARCDFWSAGWFGARLGAVAYVIPFIFVFHPELLLIGEPLDIVIAVISALVGVIYLAAGLAGYLFAPIARFNRAFLVLAGLCLIPSPLDSTLWLVVNVAGFAAGLLVAFRQRMLAPSPA